MLVLFEGQSDMATRETVVVVEVKCDMVWDE